MTTQTKPTALQAYMENLTAAQTLALNILGALDNHDTVDPDAIHWGHVGDITEIRKNLQALSDRLFCLDEYAPEAK